MNENNTMRMVQLALGKLRHVKIFRNNTGLGWAGKSRRIPNSTDMIIANAQPLHAGLCEGSSDLIGWTTLRITEDMVGQKVAVFTAIEVKSLTGRATVQQINFIRVVNESGGFGAIVRTDEDAVKFIQHHSR